MRAAMILSLSLAALSGCETERTLPTEPTPIDALPSSYAVPVSCFEMRPEDGVVAVGETIVLDGSCAREGSESIVDYDWTLGDGRSVKGTVVTTSYGSPGGYDVRLTVRDESGQQDLFIRRVVVR